MKHLKRFRSRLADAIKVLLCGRYVLCMTARGTTDRNLLGNAAFYTAKLYLECFCDSPDSCSARLDMLDAVLDTERSVITQYNFHGRCFASYDCNSENDLNELLNQEIE